MLQQLCGTLAEPAASRQVLVSAARCPPPGMGVRVLGVGGLPRSLQPGPQSYGWKLTITMGQQHKQPTECLALTRGGAVGADAPGSGSGLPGACLYEVLALAVGWTVSYGINGSS